MGKEILVETPLVGRHQLRNLALAIATAEELGKQGFPVTPDAITVGIRQTHWPGRFQVIGVAPEIVLDVAHNPDGAWALRSTLSLAYPDRPFTLVFGSMRDKAIREVAEILFPLAKQVLVARAENPRSATAHEIREAAARISVEIDDAGTVANAVARAQEMERPASLPSGLVVVTGSIYVVGEAMQALGVCP
jgi:dihydrofolate synthase/folylpolyglutamate synthase